MICSHRVRTGRCADRSATVRRFPACARCSTRLATCLVTGAPTLAAGSIVVASARKMLVRLGLCCVGIDSIVVCGFRRSVRGRFALRAGWGLRARWGLRGVERLVSRLRGRLGGHGVLLR
ncbi:hypothetical protein BN2476_1520021 [Paraburkholderia piptadeniae]|uniref:Uncharacterized protein n=1 Tax=Paraburkholderia piptadeniae TaxID=1701573 RepID=A0A1N7SX09_9BURK|nr:hypothetical protein BN2476_1520021 [Paraburkholderia piptadeniae]